MEAPSLIIALPQFQPSLLAESLSTAPATNERLLKKSDLYPLLNSEVHQNGINFRPEF